MVQPAITGLPTDSVGEGWTTACCLSFPDERPAACQFPPSNLTHHSSDTPTRSRQPVTRDGIGTWRFS